MGSRILDKIIKTKKQEIEAGRKRVPLSDLARQAETRTDVRPFKKALEKTDTVNIIAEIKRASPSKGDINAGLDPEKTAVEYESGGAACLSVLTDTAYFKGSAEDLKKARQHTLLPVLRKDFIIDPWQVYESRAAGADAILLIAEALKPGKLMDLMITAAELTLTVLLEVHQADTLLNVRSLIGFPKKGYSVIGINNRDLTTMEVDLNTTSRLAELIDNTNELVAESGINTRADVEKLKSVGVTAVLIGRVLCASDDIEKKFTDLFV